MKKKSNKKFRIADVEDDDDRSHNSQFSQSSIKIINKKTQTNKK